MPDVNPEFIENTKTKKQSDSLKLFVRVTDLATGVSYEMKMKMKMGGWFKSHEYTFDVKLQDVSRHVEVSEILLSAWTTGIDQKRGLISIKASLSTTMKSIRVR